MRSTLPLYIRTHPLDNVAIVVNEGGLPAGTQFESGLILRESVPEAHKIALQNIPQGAPVLRYGVPIGYAQKEIPAGSWVHEAILDLPQAPALEQIPLHPEPSSPTEPLTGFTFQGYRNDDGTVGTKNILGISTTVQCVSATVEYAVKKI